MRTDDEAPDDVIPEVVAAADLGSNSFHLAIARATGGELTMIDRIKERVSLRSGLDDDDLLDGPSLARALECLARFGQRLSELPTGAVRAVGTDTLRIAKNAARLLEAGTEALGHPIEVISGEEEARLIYRGVASELPHQDGERQLVIDVGGGSTECVLGVGLAPEHAVSLHIGHVAFTQRFFADGAIRADRFARAVVAARLELERLRGPFFRRDWARVVGSSGTMTSIEAILRATGIATDGITLAGVQTLQTQLVAQGHADALYLPELSLTRAQTIAGGLAIVRALFETLPIEVIRTVSSALREGVLHDLVGRYGDQDVREHTVDAMMTRFGADRDQASRVEATALALLDRAAAWFRPAERAKGRRLLSWAARLHEIGLAIGFHGHHKHGAYIVQNATTPGFSRNDTAALAALVRTHRKKLDPMLFADLWGDERRVVERLSALLRIAVRLHRNRSWRPLPAIDLTARSDGLDVTFPSGFLDAHPLTAADFADEAIQQAAIGHHMRVS